MNTHSAEIDNYETSSQTSSVITTDLKLDNVDEDHFSLKSELSYKKYYFQKEKVQLCCAKEEEDEIISQQSTVVAGNHHEENPNWSQATTVVLNFDYEFDCEEDEIVPIFIRRNNFS